MEILMKQDNSDDTIVRIWGNEGIKWINIGMSNTHNKFEDIEKAAWNQQVTVHNIMTTVS